jgi:hypothetical protein
LNAIHNLEAEHQARDRSYGEKGREAIGGEEATTELGLLCAKVVDLVVDGPKKADGASGGRHALLDCLV